MIKNIIKLKFLLSCRITSLFILFFFCSFTFSKSEDQTEIKVIKIVQDNLAAFLEKIPVGQESYYGFSNREEFKISSVGKPYRVITFSSDFFNEKELSDKNYILIQDEWRVPITVKSKYRLLFTVSQQNSTLEIVDLGGAALAKELEERDVHNLSGSHYLLRIYPLTLDFLVQNAPGASLADAIYIPLTSATTTISSLKKEGTSKLNLHEVLHLVKQQLKEKSKN